MDFKNCPNPYSWIRSLSWISRLYPCFVGLLRVESLDFCLSPLLVKICHKQKRCLLQKVVEMLDLRQAWSFVTTGWNGWDGWDRDILMEGRGVFLIRSWVKFMFTKHVYQTKIMYIARTLLNKTFGPEWVGNLFKFSPVRLIENSCAFFRGCQTFPTK